MRLSFFWSSSFYSKLPVHNFFQPFIYLTFDEDLGKPEKKEEHGKVNNKKHKKTKNREESTHLQGNDGRQSLRTKFTEEVYLLIVIIFSLPFDLIFLVGN